MSEIFRIPVKYQAGEYSMKDFAGDWENVIELSYEEYGDIVTYDVPDDGMSIVLYGIPREALENHLRALYEADGQLKKMTVNVENKDLLLYIYYENHEEAKQEIQDFAITNADSIIEKICMCEEAVSRLFVEYFDDGEYMDFHAKTGTEKQKNELKRKHKRDKYIIDSCGDYPSENIEGDNHTLKIMVQCADNEEMDYFKFAVDIMAEHIKEKASQRLCKADDFKFICVEYD